MVRNRALEGIRRAASLRPVRRAAQAQGVPIWLVGGAVRDLLSGRAHPDLDVVVPRGAAQSLGETLAAEGLGTLVELSSEAPRVVRIAGSRMLDIAELEGASIEQDLARRDFTVNAMAFELSSGRLVDPYGGAGDLGRRRLRPVSPGNLREDPLRVLRAARFIATHNLSPDAAATAACRSAAPLLSEAAPERIVAELSKLLEAPRAAPALAWAARAGILGPALGMPLPPGLSRRLRRLDASRVTRVEPSRRRMLRLALLADALGLSADEAAAWLAGRRFSRGEARIVARLLALGRSAAAVGPAGDWSWVVAAGPDGSEALLLTALTRPRAAPAVLRLTRKLRRPRPRVRVSGKDILAWTGLAPGPEIGALLAGLEVEIRRGAVRDHRSARAWSRAAAQPAARAKSQAANEMNPR